MGLQILKARDDHQPISFSNVESADASELKFKLAEGMKCSWAKSDQEFDSEVLRPRIEPWLTALLQSDHLSLLVGSGLTHAIHRVAIDKSLPGMNSVSFARFNEEINNIANKSSELAGRYPGNIEDQLRVANELLRGLEILGVSNSRMARRANLLSKNLDRILQEFTTTILKGENELITAEKERREKAFNYLVSFLMSFASRTGTRERLQIFTTNYDRYIEAGAEIAGLHLLDRFVGSLNPVFRSSRLDLDMHYNPPGIRGEPRYLEGVAKFTKLHGSLDWVDSEKSIRRISLPFGDRKSVV